MGNRANLMSAVTTGAMVDKLGEKLTCSLNWSC